jgi:hypothetical protein
MEHNIPLQTLSFVEKKLNKILRKRVKDEGCPLLHEVCEKIVNFTSSNAINSFLLHPFVVFL